MTGETDRKLAFRKEILNYIVPFFAFFMFNFWVWGRLERLGRYFPFLFPIMKNILLCTFRKKRPYRPKFFVEALQVDFDSSPGSDLLVVAVSEGNILCVGYISSEALAEPVRRGGFVAQLVA